MFGIAGIWDFKKFIAQENLNKFNDYLDYGNTEGLGTFLNKENDLGLVCKKLSQREGSIKNQMMELEGIVVIFNGRLQNANGIKQELVEERIVLEKELDVEIILKSFLKWGTASFKKFKGSFSFVIFDSRNEKVLLVRGKANSKPIYYYSDEGVFLFSSEMRVILNYPDIKKEIDFNSLGMFLRFGYVSSPFTILKNVFKLESGCFLEIDRSRRSKIERYWNVFDIEEEKYLLCEEFEEMLKGRLKESIPNEPANILLDGAGSFLTALLAKEKGISAETFSVNFEQSSEDNSGELFSKISGLKNNEFKYSLKDLKNSIINFPDIFDEPLGGNNPLYFSLVFDIFKNDSKNILTDWGSEEMLGNSGRYERISNKYSLINGFNFLAAFFRSNERISDLFNNANDFKRFYLSSVNLFLDKEVKNLLRNDFDDEKYLNKTFFFGLDRDKKKNIFGQMQLIDLRNSLEAGFFAIDKSSIFNNVRIEAIFLNDEIIELSRKMPLGCRQEGILKKILLKNVSPQMLEKRKDNSIPLDLLLRGELKTMMLDYLIAGYDLFDKKAIDLELKKFLKGKESGLRLWNVLSFLIWKERWLK